jgi:hypothetical protein
VVVVGLTVVLDPVTAPTPWLMEKVAAPSTVHTSVEYPPAVIVEGVAANDEITGAGTALTVTVADAVALPPAFVAVNV